MFPSTVRRLRYVLLAVAAFVLVGCSAGDEVPSGQGESREISAWVADYIEMIRNDPGITLSSFEETVLADSFVSDEEYREAQDRFRQCMEDLGWEVTFNDDHSFEVVGALDGPRSLEQVTSEESDLCQSGTLFHVQPIFLEQNYNPDGLSPAELIRDCLSGIGSGLAAEMTDEELLDFWLELADGRRRADVSDALCVIDPTGQMGLDEQGLRARLGWDE